MRSRYYAAGGYDEQILHPLYITSISCTLVCFMASVAPQLSVVFEIPIHNVLGPRWIGNTLDWKSLENNIIRIAVPDPLLNLVIWSAPVRALLLSIKCSTDVNFSFQKTITCTYMLLSIQRSPLSNTHRNGALAHVRQSILNEQILFYDGYSFFLWERLYSCSSYR